MRWRPTPWSSLFPPAPGHAGRQALQTEAKFIAHARKGAKIHTTQTQHPCLTVCRWEWTRAADVKIVQFVAERACKRCQAIARETPDGAQAIAEEVPSEAEAEPEIAETDSDEASFSSGSPVSSVSSWSVDVNQV